MHLKANLFTFLIAVLLLMGCKSPTTSPATTSTVSATTTSIANETQARTSVSDSNTDYAILTNLEMVEYCLPYPKDDFTEDYKASTGKGNHVLVSKDKKSKIIFSGMFLEDEFDVLYHDAEAEVQEITMADPLHNEKGEDYFELSWKEDKKMVWMKKWCREEEEETVTARFEYPEDQAEAMKKVIAVVTAAHTRCE